MKKTPWFSGDVKPARPGVYERGSDEMEFSFPFCHWDGKRWVGIGSTPDNVRPENGYVPFSFNGYGWRGLAAPATKEG